MYILHGKPTNRSFRVLWMLEELGVEYKLEPDDPRSPEALKFNPSGKVPILVDESLDGNPFIIDSAACIQYLADKHGKFTAPAGTIERGHQDSFTQFALDELDACLWVLAKHTFILPEELRVENIHAACAHDFARSMTVLEQRLGDNAYLTGDEFSVPDIIVGHCYGWSKMGKLPWPEEGKLADYAARLTDRDAFKRCAEIREKFR